MHNQAKNNLLPITIGFFLIVLVTALFFLKSSWLNKKKEATLNQEQAQEKKDDLKKYASISSEELLSEITSKKDYEILDIRNAEDFSKKHIVDSKNISLENLKEKIASFEKNKTYCIVDELGLTPEEKQVMDIFFAEGFEKIIYLEGGIYSWVSELSPTVEFGDPNSLSDQSKVNYIKSDELKKMIVEDSNILYLVDLRSPADYTGGHIKNAVNIPLENLETRRKEIPTYKRIVLLDDTGILAFQGAVRLFDMGILNVFTLSDGLKVWKEKEFEVVK
ncbi:MAG: hypothetical protein A2271_00730 [Candidatus Moranbacteria bacterium RIFOXYA12_FULL_35_19]|nr:MAG: Rhodanese-like protein [Candidatus Moranbacteria bacterium GW2011_GWF2_35_39]OGI32057.1 MAG: hypothetical protein A2343_01720 [Candidatus Moranbacteria bacterium RIFOXYB12_FULL_35_8]OGI32249.1 MAG: hypothetical protein A2489_02830 [Candidatus Moranbacteria bacterium RIFOXYC12_FULL_36_13]OGI35888.1 MAG: hypothetical protein A2271_00730 [Candidatus Moranbacteria bacterium RIFOXYA12_FULL_35_19]